MEQPQLTESSFADFERDEKRRRDLLPWWIKVFCWIFMFMGMMAALIVAVGALGFHVNLSIYGLQANHPFSVYGLLINIVLLFKGYTAYALWFEKDNAIQLGKIDAIAGIIICVAVMLIIPFLEEGFHLNLRLELALLIPYLIRLKKIKASWQIVE